MSNDLAYVIGVFLGDGSVGKDKYAFCLQSIDKDFVDNTAKSLRILTKNKVSVVEMNRKTQAGKMVHAVYASDSEFCRLLDKLTGYRKHLPIDFDSWDNVHQKYLIAGLLDSEGYVSMSRRHYTDSGHEVFDMHIGIGATDIWLNELHRFLQKNEYGVGMITREILPSGLIFSKFRFNKKKFIEKKLFFTIKRKQDRIEHYKLLFPGSTTIRGLPKSQYMRKRVSEFSKRRERIGGKFVKIGNDIV